MRGKLVLVSSQPSAAYALAVEKHGASGLVSYAQNLEVARALGRLIQRGRLAPPRRTIRFVFPPEIEGTIALLNARPELARRAHVDATKLRRAAFLAAASAWYLAGLDAAGVPGLWAEVRRHVLARNAGALARSDRLRAEGQAAAADDLLRFHFAYEEGVVASIAAFAEVPPAVRESASAFLAGLRRQVGASTPDAPATAPPRETSPWSTAARPIPRAR